VTKFSNYTPQIKVFTGQNEESCV